MKIKEIEKIARAILDTAPYVTNCELVRRRDHLEIKYLDQTFFLFGKKEDPAFSEDFWFENKDGHSSYPLSDCKSTFICLLVFAFESKLRADHG